MLAAARGESAGHNGSYKAMAAQTHFTVEQASRWLTCAQPVPLSLLQRLGKDCSMVCRIRGATFVDVPVQGKNWPTERGYPAAIIQEVFQANPDTRPYIPQPAVDVRSEGRTLVQQPANLRNIIVGANAQD